MTEKHSALQLLLTLPAYDYWNAELICLQLPLAITCSLSYLVYGIGGPALLASAVLHFAMVVYQLDIIKKRSATFVTTRISPDFLHEILPSLLTGLLMISGAWFVWVFVTTEHIEADPETRLELLFPRHYTQALDMPILGIARIAATSNIVFGFCSFLGGAMSAANYTLHRKLDTIIMMLVQTAEDSPSLAPESKTDPVPEPLKWRNCLGSRALILFVTAAVRMRYIEGAITCILFQTCVIMFADPGGIFVALIWYSYVCQSGRPGREIWFMIALNGLAMVITAVAILQVMTGGNYADGDMCYKHNVSVVAVALGARDGSCVNVEGGGWLFLRENERFLTRLLMFEKVACLFFGTAGALLMAVGTLKVWTTRTRKEE